MWDHLMKSALTENIKDTFEEGWKECNLLNGNFCDCLIQDSIYKILHQKLNCVKFLIDREKSI